MGCGEGVLDVPAGAGAGVDRAQGAEAFESGDVMLAALALGVRTIRAAAVGAFLPLESEPAEVLDQGLDEKGAAAGGVEVFIAQHERTAVLGGALLGDPEGLGMTEVQPNVEAFRRIKIFHEFEEDSGRITELPQATPGGREPGAGQPPPRELALR